MIKDIYYQSANTLLFFLEDDSTVIIQFAIVTVDNKRLFKRVIVYGSHSVTDISDFDAFNEGLTIEDYMQWTCDNLFEILDALQ